jgi:hypothetical protein
MLPDFAERRGRPRADRKSDQLKQELCFLLRAAKVPVGTVADTLDVSRRTVSLWVRRAARLDTPMVRLAKAAMHLPEFRA